MNSKKRSSGFSLMELLIVMVLLGILVAIATGSYASSVRRGRDNRRKGDLRNIAGALEAYFNDKGVYPTGIAGVMYGCGALDTQICDWGGQFKDKNGTLYMVLIPKDPSISKYYYTSGSVNGTSYYKIYAKLENTKDEGNGVNQSGYINTNCASSGTELCTYGISSTNTTP